MKASSGKCENLLPASVWPCSFVITSYLLFLQCVNSHLLLLIVHRLHSLCTDLCTEALGDYLELVEGSLNVRRSLHWSLGSTLGSYGVLTALYLLEM